MSQHLSDKSGVRFPPPRSDSQIEAILSDADGYFAHARAKAWDEAVDRVETELAARARRRGR